jgi:hypothetical protein
MERLKVGDQVYYTGDRANADAFGEVTEVIPGTATAPITYVVIFENGYTMHVQEFLFTGPGRRFMLRSEYDADKAAKLAEMREQYLKRQES